MSRNTHHITRRIGVGCVFAWLLSTTYILLPTVPAYALECSCVSSSGDQATCDACVAYCGSSGRGGMTGFNGISGDACAGGAAVLSAPVPAAAPATADEAAGAPTPRTPTEFGYVNPLGTTDLNTVINRIIKTALGFVGALFLAMFVYAGVLYMTAGGDAKKVDSAKKTMLNAVFGILIIAMAYTIISLIFQTASQVRG